MLSEDLYQQFCELPMLDIHSHLHPDQMAAADLDKVIYYHMLRYPLRAAGVPEEKLWPGQTAPRVERPIFADAEVGDGLAQMHTQGFGWMLRGILRDLYGFDEALNAESLPRLRAAFAEKTAHPDWGRQVLGRAKIPQVYSSAIQDQESVSPNADLFRFTLEMSPGNGTREFQSWSQRLTRLGEQFGREITNLATLRLAVAAFHEGINWSQRTVQVEWVSSMADFYPVEDSVVDRIITAVLGGAALSPEESGLLEGAYIRCTCQAILPHARIFQLCYGTQFITPGAPHPITRCAPRFASGLGQLAGEFPGLHFSLLSSVEGDEQALCSLCQGYANVSLGGFWYYNFYPSIMQRAWQRRLDMVPLNRICGFFSDGYCVDWIFARAQMTRRVLANTLAERIAWGYCTEDDAQQIARAILYETPARLFA